MWTWFFRRRQTDDLIDLLIQQKGARPVAGMTRADWQTINRVGAARWREMAQAQAKSGQRDAHRAGPRSIDLRKAG